ncbi:MAG: M48 family metalloprotease [Desulfobacterales bacterium]|nr:MAG: M48 family metalloprotease [Desulfobacterales bacterium]
MAVVLFAIDIYGLNLPSFFVNVTVFAIFPTLLALLFLGLFVIYLAIVWTAAHGPYRKLYRADISRSSYVFSNISFSLPVLLPWLILSGLADIILVLPFETPKRVLATTEGEVVYFLIFLFAVAIVGPVLIQKFWRCTPLESGYHRSRIESLCLKAGLEYANILHWPIFGGKMITAGVMGLIKRFRYILVTKALLRLLEPEEIDAVIAHEIGHVKRRHLLFYLFFFVGFMLLSLTTFNVIDFDLMLLVMLLFATPLYQYIFGAGNPHTAITFTTAMYSVSFILIFIVYFRYIFGYFMRNFERQADIYVFTLFDSARSLISTLEKIAITSGHSPDRPNWHHFSIKERVDYLSLCEENPLWINRHEKKVRRSIAAYLAGIILIGGAGYYLNYGEEGGKLNNYFWEKILFSKNEKILQLIEKNNKNPYFYQGLGDSYVEYKLYEKAIQAYQKSLALRPDNPHVLNNLAWLYATADDERFRNPKLSLELARKAVELDPSPHIWDTLAESYYVNGFFEEAINAGQHALARAKSNRTYYEDQLRKYREAAVRKSSRWNVGLPCGNPVS